MSPRIHALLIALAAGAGLGVAEAAVYDVQIEPSAGDTYALARFRLRVDDAPVRGVYFFVDPYLADSRPSVDDPALRDLAARESFALLGAQLDSSHMETGIGTAVLRALAIFTDLSGHPELAHAALFLDGWSWGGQFSYHFTLWRPDRVIGFITQKGGYHSTEPAGDAIIVPGFLVIGENDLPYRLENLTGIFLAHRPLGARWILAKQPGAAHERVTDRTLLDGFVHDVSLRRLPAVIPPDAPVPLAVIEESASWLGDLTTARIGAFTCFDAAGDSASWCVTRAVAEAWQGFVSAGAVTDTCACTTAAPPRPPVCTLAPAHPNPANPAAILAFTLATAGTAYLTVHDLAGRHIATLASGRQEAGPHAVRWDGSDAHGRCVPSGIYLVRLEAGNVVRTRTITVVR